MASRTSVDQPRRSAYRVYMRSRSPANSADSSPPSPDFTSSRTSLPSDGVARHQQVAQPLLGAGREPSRAARPPRRTPRPRRPAREPPRGRRRAAPTPRGRAAIELSSAYRWLRRRASDWSACTDGSASCPSSSACSAASWETTSNTGAPGVGVGFTGRPVKHALVGGRDRVDPADRGAAGGGRPGGGRAAVAPPLRAPAGTRRGFSMVAVPAACGLAGLAWPAIAWWRTGSARPTPTRWRPGAGA